MALQPEAERYLFLFLGFQQLRTIGEAEFLGLIFAGLRRQLGEGSELDRFPKYLALGDARLALHYRFDCPASRTMASP